MAHGRHDAGLGLGMVQACLEGLVDAPLLFGEIYFQVEHQ
jgi:hypothetical protein